MSATDTRVTHRKLAPPLLIVATSVCALLSSIASAADSQETEDWGVHWQSTYVTQTKSAFTARYSGANSLLPKKEASYSFTATAALGWRPWPGTEIYINPELAQGVPMSGLTGLGGFANGELARTSGPHLTLYRARSFLRQTWQLEGDTERVESDMNQLAGSVSKRRLVLTAGTLTIQDIFDDNRYSHDPKTQFLNWALITHGAYDFAADARGYSSGLALEYFHDNWAVRLARFAQPKEPNGQAMDLRLMRHFGDQVELEYGYDAWDKPGKLRLLAFRNVAKMASFRDAIVAAAGSGSIPDLNAVRVSDHAKLGVGLNLEQSLSADLGVFGRAMWSDGKTETYAYTEIDRSVAVGAVLKGTSWGRGQDEWGIAIARNGLSGDHRRYLAAGGLGFFIGDGKLAYRPESIAETYYAARLTRQLWLSADYQHISNPAYNADRGPVRVASIRLHAEF